MGITEGVVNSEKFSSQEPTLLVHWGKIWGLQKMIQRDQTKSPCLLGIRFLGLLSK